MIGCGFFVPNLFSGIVAKSFFFIILQQVQGFRRLSLQKQILEKIADVLQSIPYKYFNRACALIAALHYLS